MEPSISVESEPILTAEQETEEVRKSFWKMLDYAIPKSGYVSPEGTISQILDIGCGRAKVDAVLNWYFGAGKFGAESDKVKVSGIDIKKEAIDEAKRTYSFFKSYQFVHGDATQLDEYSQIPDKADVILIRFQQIVEDKKNWGRIFEQAVKKLHPEGILIVTSIGDIGHQEAMAVFEKLPCRIVLNEKNPYARSSSSKNISYDRNFAIIRKQLSSGRNQR